MNDYPVKGISKDAYGGVKGGNYEPYVPTSEVMPYGALGHSQYINDLV